MSVGFFEIPILLFALAIPVVVIVLIVNAVGKRRHGARMLVAGLMAVAIVFVLLLGIAFLGVIVARTAVYHNQTSSVTPSAAVAQAQAEVERAKAQVDQARARLEAQAAQTHARVEAQIAQTQARIQAGTSPGDRVMVEDALTRNAPPVEPSNVESFQVVDENPPTVQATPSPPPALTGVTIVGDPWSDAVEVHQDFEADVYPSIEAAAEALGRNVGRDLMEHVPSAQAQNNTPIYVWMHNDDQPPATQEGVLLVTRPVLEAVADGIRQKLVNPGVVSVERPTVQSSLEQTATIVRVTVKDVAYDNHNRWGRYSVAGSGFLLAEVDTPDFDFSRNMRFEQAPWVTDPSRFANDFKNGDWLIAYSGVTNTQQTFAHNEAIQAAAKALLSKAEARIAQMSPPEQNRYHQKQASDPDWLTKRIADELVSRNLQTDSFTQRFDRPNYTVWREAVLVDASPTRVEEIARSLVQGINVQVSHHRKTWFSFVALAGLIFGTYLFLNMATKGYYVWMLRLAALGGVAAAGFLILHLS